MGTKASGTWWLSGKESACNAEDSKDIALVCGSGRSPGVGNGNPFPYSWPENSVDREAWRGTVRRVEKVGQD